MKETEAPRIHFALVAIGTVWYLVSYRGVVTLNNGVPEMNVPDFAFLCRSTMFYLAFVVLTFGHALLWRSPPEDSRLSEEEQRILERMKSRHEEKA